MMLEALSGTDIYLIDQIMKGRFEKGHKVLDAGCGRGRNMPLLHQLGCEVRGCDFSDLAIEEAITLTGIPADRFRVFSVEEMTYGDNEFDHVISNAVLHFSSSEDHFLKMMAEMTRVLKPGGVLFIRMTSVFGLPNNYTKLRKGRYFLMDGSERFLLTRSLLNKTLAENGLILIEPVKSVLVENLRSMTTLVLMKEV